MFRSPSRFLCAALVIIFAAGTFMSSEKVSAATTPTLTVTSQRNTEVWQKGVSQKVTWTSTSIPDTAVIQNRSIKQTVDIYLVAAKKRYLIAKDLEINKRKTSVTLDSNATIPEGAYNVRIEYKGSYGSAAGVSAATVQVQAADAPSLTVTSPRAGISVSADSQQRITWTANFVKRQSEGDKTTYGDIKVVPRYGVGADLRSLDLSKLSQKDRDTLLKLSPGDLTVISNLQDEQLEKLTAGSVNIPELTPPGLKAINSLGDDGFDMLKKADFLGINEFATDAALKPLEVLADIDPLTDALFGGLFEDEKKIATVKAIIEAVPVNGGVSYQLGTAAVERGKTQVSFKKVPAGEYKIRLTAKLKKTDIIGESGAITVTAAPVVTKPAVPAKSLVQPNNKPVPTPKPQESLRPSPPAPQTVTLSTVPGSLSATASCSAGSPLISLKWDDAGRGAQGYNIDITPNNGDFSTNSGWGKTVTTGIAPTSYTIASLNGFNPFGSRTGTFNFEANKYYFIRVYYRATQSHTNSVAVLIPDCAAQMPRNADQLSLELLREAERQSIQNQNAPQNIPASQPTPANVSIQAPVVTMSCDANMPRISIAWWGGDEVENGGSDLHINPSRGALEANNGWYKHFPAVYGNQTFSFSDPNLFKVFFRPEEALSLASNTTYYFRFWYPAGQRYSPIVSATTANCTANVPAPITTARNADELSLELLRQAQERAARPSPPPPPPTVIIPVTPAAPAPVASTPVKPAAVANKEPIGFLDGANCSVLSGWAYDENVPTASIPVHIYQDGPAGSGKFLAVVDTTGSRPDVNTAKKISGNHGFAFATPSGLKDGKNHKIYAYAINQTAQGAQGNNPQLSGSPKTIKCSAQGAAAATSNPSLLQSIKSWFSL